MTAANRIIVLSMGVVLLGASSLLASSRRADSCDLWDRTGEGSCPHDTMAECENLGGGCPAAADRAPCEANGATYVIHCCFNGNSTGVCAP